MSKVYRLKSPTLGIYPKDGHNTLFTVPKDALITVIDGPLDGTRLVDCLWNGAKIMLFTVDIRERGTLVQAAA